MNKITLQRATGLILLSLVVAALYGQFVWNPIVFDDMYFFIDEGRGVQPLNRMAFSWLEPRSLPYSTLAWTKELFGLELIYFRLGNLGLHLLTSLVLYQLLKTVFTACYRPKSSLALDASQAALLGAALFSLHPVATYAVGYLVQRTILMATLFSLLTMLIYARAQLIGSRKLLWLCIPFYYFAVFSKEHAVMLFVVLLAMSILLSADWRTRLKAQWMPLTLMLCISVGVVVAKKQLLGATYEMDAGRLLGEDMGPLPYPLSVITQCGLFFKYVALWLVPNINWMSIDMREPFVRTLLSPHLLGVVAFVAWGALALYLLWQRGHRGLVGMALFFPWVLFFSELASVRIQEPFVLYRSYLWAGGALLALPVALNGLDKKLLVLVSTAVLVTFFASGMERLVTLSQPILLWADALKLVDETAAAPGTERIYYNLGVSYMKGDRYKDAEFNLKKAIGINPESAAAHAALGGVYNVRQQWSEALTEYTRAHDIDQKLGNPPNWRYFAGRARAHEGAGELKEAIADYVLACGLEIKVCDNLRASAKKQ